MTRDGNADLGGRSVWLLALFLACVNGYLFTTGYWLNADDVMFLQIGTEGWDAVVEAAKIHAGSQGRIGQYVQVPLNILGAFWADAMAFRIFYVAAYMFVIYLYARWFDRISEQRIAAITFLLAAALTPLHFYHLPPNSFPLQNTVPFIVLIFCRLFIARQYADGAIVAGNHLKVLLATIIFSLIMTISEYSFLLGTGMLAAEYIFRIARYKSLAAIKSIFANRVFVQDIVSCLLPLVLYVAWRAAHPSAYDGNSLDGFSHPQIAFRTWLSHAFGLNYMAFFQSEALLRAHGVSLVIGLATGAATAAAVLICAPALARIRGILPLLLVPAGLSLYVTFPASMTAKQQQWCMELGACVFLDSRTAFMGSITLMVVILAILLRATGFSVFSSWSARLVLALCAGAMTCFTFFHNAWMSDVMALEMQVWKNADILSCSIDPGGSHLRAQMDPSTRVGIHPHLDPEKFWRVYIENARRYCATPATPATP